jgi:hypothetical protein
VPPGSGESWARPPGELRLAFVLGDDEPAGDVGMEDHASMVCGPAGAEQ